MNKALADVKSAFLSKTNITALLLLIFSVLVGFGALPADYATESFVATVVGAGATLVMVFRTFTNAILRLPGSD